MGTTSSKVTGGSSGTDGNLGESTVNGAAPTAEEFETGAKLLAAKYHDTRLRRRGGSESGDTHGRRVSDAAVPSVDGVASSAPLRSRSLSSAKSAPSAEHERLPRQVRRDTTAATPHHDGIETIVEPPTSKGQGADRSSRMSRPAKPSSKIGGVALRGDTPGASEQDRFVHRDGMFGLARELRYDISPQQAACMFDMLDPQREGRISKADLCRHFVPLVRRTGRSGPPAQGSKGPDRSRKGSLSSGSSGSRTPPRPMGTPPPGARRRLTSPSHGERGSDFSSATTTINPTASSPKERRKGSSPTTAGTLRPISSPGHVRDRPSKFWLTPCDDGGGNALASASVPSLEGAAGSVHRSRLERKHKAKKEVIFDGVSSGPRRRSRGVKTLGADTIVGPRARQHMEEQDGEVPGSDIIEGTRKSSADSSPAGKNALGRAQSGDKGNIHDEKEAAASTATKGPSKLCSIATESDPAAVDQLADKPVVDWTAADVRTWVRSLPRGLAAFAEAKAFADGQVDGKKLATLKLSDLKRKEFRHAKLKAKIPMALWVEIKQLQQTVPVPAAPEIAAARVIPSRFSPGQMIVDEAVNSPLCTVKQSVGQGAFGEVYQVVWTGIGADRGTTLAMKTIRLADVNLEERDGYRIILLEEILTAVRVKPHPNVVNVRFAHIMGFCSDNEEYFCFEDFVTGRDLEEVIGEGEGELYGGTPAEVQGRLLSYSIQLARGLGHIHRCGVLHQDIKSANVMVSNDAELLVTDFGFAAVGTFSPPPQAVREPRTVPANATTLSDKVGIEPTANGPTGRRTCDRAVHPGNPQGRVSARGAGGKASSERMLRRKEDGADNVDTPDSGGKPSTGGSWCDNDMEEAVRATAESKNGAEVNCVVSSAVDEEAKVVNAHPLAEGGTVSATLLRRSQAGPTSEQPGTPCHPSNGGGSDVEKVNRGRPKTAEFRTKNGESTCRRPPHWDSILFGSLKGYTPRYQSPEVSAIIEEKRGAAAKGAMPHAGAPSSQEKTPQKLLLSPSPGTQDTASAQRTPFTHRSDMWAAGVVILEMYAGGLAALPEGRGDNALDLLETLLDNTSEATVEMEVGGADENRANMRTSMGRDTDTSRAAYNSGGAPQARATRATARERAVQRKVLRVEMPGGVLAVLRDIFQWEAGDRPSSMEVLAARLSLTLGDMLDNKLAVLPCPTDRAPTPSSLREGEAAYAESAENHAKVGRLHMWLGKALFLKGDGRRDQAVQEYREGVRVLQESKADQRSPSMALFRWYLGKALLETGEVDEAMPHLTEAVSIDPESAKYLHTLGLAKCATGDEVGAREDLLEAALLEEEDAEERNQLRMKRMREKQRQREDDTSVSEKSDGAGEAAASREAPSPQADDATGNGGKLAAMMAQGESAIAKSGFIESRLLLESASASSRMYALEKLKDYRTVRAISKGVSDVRGGGDQTVRDATALSERRRFSAGDEIVCGPDVSAPSKSLEPLRCMGETFVIDGDLLPGQASLHFPGEVYTAATTTKFQRGEASGDISDRGRGGGTGRAYHVVHLRLKTGDNKPAATHTATSPAQEASSTGSTNGDRQLAPIDDKERRLRGASVSSGCNKASEEVSSGPSSRASNAGSKLRVESSPPLSSSPKNPRPRSTSTPSKREEDCVSVLEAAGRAAMVGFHAHLAGAMRQLTWGEDELTLIADSIPAACSTLREACMSGGLYRTTGSGGQAKHTAQEEKPHASVVVDRILKLATQTAAAIAHCHRRGVLLRDISPRDVLVTHLWDAVLRPNYQHAHEGQRWATISAHKQQRGRPSLGPSFADSSEMPLSAPYTNATSSDYQSSQSVNPGEWRIANLLLSSPSNRAPAEVSHVPPLQSPEIALIRSQSEPRQRVSGRALRLSTEATSPLSPEGIHAQKRRSSSLSPSSRKPRTSPEAAIAEDRGEGGHVRGDSISDAAAGAASRDGTSAPSMIAACESDIWAWALMVLQMFSDEAWPPGRGQEGLQALEALLLRADGVEAWTTDGVVSWFHEIGLWSGTSEREIRTFKIAGPQLLVPTCRRDIVEKLGLFMMDGELSCKLWESIAGGLQRWSMPPRLAEILRRCLAKNPNDRFATMEQVCDVLRDIAVRSGCDSDAPGLATKSENDENAASDRFRTGTILNDIGVCFSTKGLAEKAESYHKMALLSSDDIVEAYYNLGLIYSTPAFNKFREAKQAFDAATEGMGKLDPRRKCSVELSKAAERKSKYHQSEEMMKALSGKYSSVSPQASGDRRGGGGAPSEMTSIKHLSDVGTKRDEADDGNRRSSFPPAELKPYSSWSSSKGFGRSSASSATIDSSGMWDAKVSPSRRPLSAARSLTPPKKRLGRTSSP